MNSSKRAQFSPEQANLTIFKLPELYKKRLEVKYLFKFELKKAMSLMGFEKFLLKTITLIGENLLSKKEHTEHKHSVFFESRNN